MREEERISWRDIIGYQDYQSQFQISPPDGWPAARRLPRSKHNIEAEKIERLRRIDIYRLVVEKAVAEGKEIDLDDPKLFIRWEKKLKAKVPTQIGWYWFKLKKEANWKLARLVEITEDLFVVDTGRELCEEVTSTESEFIGPINPPASLEG